MMVLAWLWISGQTQTRHLPRIPLEPATAIGLPSRQPAAARVGTPRDNRYTAVQVSTQTEHHMPCLLCEHRLVQTQSCLFDVMRHPLLDWEWLLWSSPLCRAA